MDETPKAPPPAKAPAFAPASAPAPAAAPHACCPKCHSQTPHVAAYDSAPDGKGIKTTARPARDADAAKCNHCGWKGTFSDLIDTVAAGHTKA